MHKSAFILSPLFAALFAVAGAANAADNSQITITSNVVAATCDVSVSNPNLDLGNFSRTAFEAVRKPVAKSVKKFTVGLSNCDSPVASGLAGIKVSGQTLGGNPDIFNTTGTNTGIMLSPQNKADEYIKAGDTLTVATVSATAKPGDLNGQMLSLQAGLASTSTSPEIGLVSAPVLFSFVYN
ncbi:type 1 fimbrial protein [Serratia marcescens]|nr:type 1 fimbrial protein [Serratia marcescens]